MSAMLFKVAIFEIIAITCTQRLQNIIHCYLTLMKQKKPLFHFNYLHSIKITKDMSQLNTIFFYCSEYYTQLINDNSLLMNPKNN